MRQLSRLVDHDGQVLGANPVSIASILDLDQRHAVLVKLTDNAGRDQWVGHIYLCMSAGRRTPGWLLRLTAIRWCFNDIDLTQAIIFHAAEQAGIYFTSIIGSSDHRGQLGVVAVVE